MTARPARSPGLHASVLDALGARIVAGELAVGQVLTMDAVDHEYAVSAVGRRARRSGCWSRWAWSRRGAGSA